MKKFSFTKMWFEPMFLTGSLAVFKIAAKPLKWNFWGLVVLAAPPRRGEMRPNYFQYTQPPRKSQIRLAPFAGLGNQIKRNFGLKNQLAVLFE